MKKNVLLKKLDALALSHTISRSQIIACDNATVQLILGDIDSAMNILRKAHIQYEEV